MCTELIKIRKDLHAHPELSNNEFGTAQKIIKYVSKFNPTEVLRNIGGTGVLVEFDSKKDGPTILFRAELDALPIPEQNKFEHRSVHKDVSHKCGHDGHMTILLGLAKQIDSSPLKKGKVVLLFQPSEEIGAGAQAVLQDEVFKKMNPDYVFALHNLPEYPLHYIVVKKNYFTASVKSLIIKLIGKTAHAAEPENGSNPALAIAKILLNAKALTNENPKDSNFSLVTPIHIHMGSINYGTSAGYGEIHLTIRAWNEDQLTILQTKLSEMVSSIAAVYNVKTNIESTHHFVANKNDSDAVDLILQSAKENNLSIIERPYPFKWGEDFGLFTQSFKGAMFGIGAGLNSPALHNPDYDFPDEIITTGVNLFYSISQKILY